RAECAEPPITGVPGARLEVRFREDPASLSGSGVRRPPPRFRTIQVCSEKFRSAPRTACPLGSRLSVRQETLRCWVVTPGRKGKVRRDAPRVHYAARQRGLVAARGERTADAEVADHRALEPDEGLG